MARKRRQARTRGDFDAVTIGEALSRPGMDPRVWCSYGIVDQQDEIDGEPVDPVEFDDEYGPLVSVTLQPSGTPCRCRVAVGATGGVGNGESEYHPFVSGDEVLVVIPEGSEDTDCAIIGRLNNAIDKFPSESVAGQDPTGNKFGFQRRRTPFVQEWADAWMVRSASTGAFLLINAAGNITLRDGEGGAFQMTPDILGYSEPPGDDGSSKAVFQYDLTGRRIVLQMDSAQLTINSEDADANAGQTNLSVPADLFVALGTNQPAEHVATVEFVAACFDTFAAALAAPALGPAALLLLEAAWASGGAPLLPPSQLALAAGFPLAAAFPKPPANPATGIQALPKLGAAFFHTG